MSAALYTRYKKFRFDESSPIPEEQIPDTYRYVQAEVLNALTPLAVCRAAAGQHQALQSDNMPPSLSDIAVYIAQLAVEKAQECEGNMWLTQRDLWSALTSCGVAKRTVEDPQNTDESGSMQTAEVIAALIAQVMFPFTNRKSTHFCLPESEDSGHMEELRLLHQRQRRSRAGNRGEDRNDQRTKRRGHDGGLQAIHPPERGVADHGRGHAGNR